MKKESKAIITAWLDYLKCSGAEKSKISAGQVHEDHQLVLGKANCKEHEAGIILSIPDDVAKSWRKRFVKYDQQGRITGVEPVNLLFPVLRCITRNRDSNKASYLPLFYFPLPKAFFEQGANELFIPVKDGEQISALPFAFREMFGIQLDELGEDRHMMSIISALTGEKYDSFLAAFAGLQAWIGQQPGGRHRGLETAFNALIAPWHNDDFNLKRDIKDFTWLGESPKGEFPLLEQYLNDVHDPLAAPEWQERVTHGLFETRYPLGHGQMQAIQAINQDARLVTVQGAPGTGKTTLFKSLIAQKVVERALAITDGNDRNLGMLVTSFAIKAVDNIIDDLRQDPVTQSLDWLWFNGGSNDRVAQEIPRLERHLQRLQQESVDTRAWQEHQSVLHRHRDALQSQYERYNHDRQTMLDAISACGLHTAEVGELEPRFIARLEALSERLQQSGITLALHNAGDIDPAATLLQQRLQELQQQKERYQQADRLYQSLTAIWPQPWTAAEMLHWIASPLRKALEHHFGDYPRSGIKSYLAGWFAGKYHQRVRQMCSALPEACQHFGLAALSHSQLAALAEAGSELASRPAELALLSSLAEAQADLQHEQRLRELSGQLKELSDLWRNIGTAQRAAAHFRQHYPEGSWCDILRQRFIRQHREMFEAAVGLLWQEQLKRKERLAEELTHWQTLIGGRREAGYDLWLGRLDEFYQALSLVYPVMATTLVSAWKMAGYRHLDELKGHKPWHLVLCDEAGMLPVESLVPLLSRAERAMIVGDPLQIEPIRNLSENMQTRLKAQHFAENSTLYERVSPATVTGWHRAAGTLTGRVSETGSGIILDEHRRCQPPIADLFIRLAGYRGVTVETAAADDRIARAFANSGGHHLMFYSVEGKKGGVVNTNLDEVDAIEQLVNKLKQAGYDLTRDIGIITPYANQKSLLIQRLGERMQHAKKNCIGTVHQFQGVGFEVIIYSPVIFHPLDKPDFQNKKPNMLNVAVSRAKQQFIVVGNVHRLRQAGGYLKVLADRVAQSFLLEQGSQHPQFDALSNTPLLQRYYRDCEHIAAFEALTKRCEQELIVITPWIRKGEKEAQRPELALLLAAQRRGVKVKIYYGYFNARYDRLEDNNQQLVAEYVEALGQENVVRLAEGTHEKVMMVDGRYIVLGSWNWLSHGYHSSCQCGTEPGNAIRHEISAELDDASLVKELRERLVIG